MPSVLIVCTHGIFAEGVLTKLAGQPDVLETICTDTVPMPPDRQVPELRVLSVAPALAGAMRRMIA